MSMKGFVCGLNRMERDRRRGIGRRTGLDKGGEGLDRRGRMRIGLEKQIGKVQWTEKKKRSWVRGE